MNRFVDLATNDVGSIHQDISEQASEFFEDVP